MSEDDSVNLPGTVVSEEVLEAADSTDSQEDELAAVIAIEAVPHLSTMHAGWKENKVAPEPDPPIGREESQRSTASTLRKSVRDLTALAQAELAAGHNTSFSSVRGFWDDDTNTQGRESAAFPPDSAVVVVEATQEVTPGYYLELQRKASFKRQASKLSVNASREPSRQPSRLSKTSSLKVILKRAASGLGVSDKMLEIRAVKQLHQFPMLSDTMANTLQGYFHCKETKKIIAVNQGPLYKMMLIPFVSFLPVLLYAIPTSWGREAKESGAIWETWVLWAPILVVTTALFPLWISSWSQIEYKSNRIFGIYFGLTWGLVGTICTLAPLWATNLIALPFVKLAQAAAFLIYLGFSVVFGMKPDNRKSGHVFRRAAIGLCVAMSVIIVFAFIYPLVNIAFLRTKSGFVQFGIAVVYWALSSIYVMILNKIAKRERPDMYPVIAYLTVFFYNFFLSSVFSAVQAWYIFVTFLLLDVGESAWYCHLAASAVHKILEAELEEEEANGVAGPAMASDEKKPEANGVAGPAIASDETKPEAGAVADEEQAGKVGCRNCVADRLHVKVVNRCLCVISLPVAKLLAAAQAPVVYAASLFTLRACNPKMNGAFTFLTQAQVEANIMYICIHVAVEGLLFVALREWVKRKCGVDMWLVARGTCHLFFYELIFSQWTAIMCYLALQWAPGGVDWTFKFHFLHSDAIWHGGMCWTLPGEPGLEACTGLLGSG